MKKSKLYIVLLGITLSAFSLTTSYATNKDIGKEEPSEKLVYYFKDEFKPFLDTMFEKDIVKKVYSSQKNACFASIGDSFIGSIFGGIFIGGLSSLFAKDKEEAFKRWSTGTFILFFPFITYDAFNSVREKKLVRYHGEWVEPGGLVKYESEWMKPEEKYEREQIKKGLVKYQGIWITPEERFEAEQTAKGLVKFKGEWMTPQEKDAEEEKLKELNRQEAKSKDIKFGTLAKLEPATGILCIYSDPTGAKVVVTTQDAKIPSVEETTPAKIELPIGKYIITLSKEELYEPITLEASIEGGKETKLEIKLSPNFGELKVSTNLEGTKIFLNNHYKGETPLYLPKIKAGRYQVRVESSENLFGYPKYLPKEESIVINGGKLLSLNMRVEPNFGTIHITSNPEGGNITIIFQQGKIFVKGKTTPTKIELLSGEYTISLSKKPIYETVTTHISIEGGKFSELKIDLLPIPFLKEKFVRIPAGEFKMGDDRGNKDEKPVHKIYLNEYWIGKYEVTVKEYAEFVYATNYKKPVGDENCNWDTQGRKNHPINYVSWNNAQAYVKWLSNHNKYGLKFRLPTEAEWEKAARGSNGWVFPWGNNWDGKRINFSDKNCKKLVRDNSTDDRYATTAPVGSYESGKSYYGAYDMAGNVSEWTNSLYRPYPYNSNDERENIELPGNRVIRGGAWDCIPEYLQSFLRSKSSPNNQSPTIGFRIVISSEDN